jgi:hypothetical protein
MSSGGVFQLIANDGKADELIMATCLLKARIASMGDSMPTLGDIERTHVLFMHSSFKPFAAFGMEYRKITPDGTVDWGNSLVYSIPQAGDFFSDFGIRFTCDNVTATTGYLVDTDGDDIAAEAYLQMPSGEIVADGLTPRLNVPTRFTSYPGERAVAKLSFSVNANTLDEYTHKTSAAYRKHYIPASKMAGYKRLVGEQVPREMLSASHMVTGQNPVWGGAAAAADADAHQRRIEIVDGLQTPKTTHSNVTFWHVGRLWFAQQKQQMVPSVSIPYGDRHITVTLAAKTDMIKHVEAGILTVARAAAVVPAEDTAQATTVDATTFTLLDKLIGGVAYSATEATGGGCATADMYMNNVYVLPEVHNIFIARVGFSLIRVHRAQTIAGLTTGDNDKLLSQLKWPIERMVFGVQPTANTTAAVSLDDWWRMSSVTAKTSTAVATVPYDGLRDDTTTVYERYLTTAAVDNFNYKVHANAISTLSISLHGQKLYDAMPKEFFTDYVPTCYGKSEISASEEDPASGMISFALIGGIYQPNGHLNVSRAREFYFQPNCDVAGTLILEADAINFLLISDGNAVLRYST